MLGPGRLDQLLEGPGGFVLAGVTALQVIPLKLSRFSMQGRLVPTEDVFQYMVAVDVLAGIVRRIEIEDLRLQMADEAIGVLVVHLIPIIADQLDLRYPQPQRVVYVAVD